MIQSKQKFLKTFFSSSRKKGRGWNVWNEFRRESKEYPSNKSISAQNWLFFSSPLESERNSGKKRVDEKKKRHKKRRDEDALRSLSSSVATQLDSHPPLLRSVLFFPSHLLPHLFRIQHRDEGSTWLESSSRTFYRHQVRDYLYLKRILIFVVGCIKHPNHHDDAWINRLSCQELMTEDDVDGL